MRVRFGLVRSFVRRHRGWFGLAVGICLGLLVGLLAPSIFPGKPPAEVMEPGTLVVYGGTDDSEGHQRKKLIDHWNEIPGNPTAVYRDIEGNGQYAFMASDAQKSRSDVDIYVLDLIWTADFAANDYILPLDRKTIDTSGFLGQPLKSCEYQGKLWCLPFNSDAGLLYYNSDLVPKGPQTTWQGLKNKTDEVLAAHKEIEAGFTGQFNDYEGLTVNALEMIWAYGGELVNADNEVHLDQGVLAALKELSRGFTSDPRYILPESKTFQENESRDAFRQGKVLFMRNWPVHYRTLKDPDDSGLPPIQFDVKELQHGSALGGQNLAISHHSDQPIAARKLIEFLTSERSQQILFERGGFAATREVVYHDQFIQAEYGYTKTLLSAIKHAHLRPVTPHYERFSEEFRKGVKYAIEHEGDSPSGWEATLQAALRGH